MEDFKSWEEMSELEQAQCTYWDMYKDAYGVRPRGIDTSTWTLADFDAEFKRMSVDIAVNEMERHNAEVKAAHDFEERVKSLITAGAKTREQALRWIHEAEGTQGDDEYLCFTLGLAYGYFRKAA